MTDSPSEQNPHDATEAEPGVMAEVKTGRRVAHPYIADEGYRRFADDFDWGLL